MSHAPSERSVNADTSESLTVYSGHSLHTNAATYAAYQILHRRDACASSWPTVMLRQSVLQTNKGANQSWFPSSQETPQYRGNFSLSPRHQLHQTVTHWAKPLSLQPVVNLTDRYVMEKTPDNIKTALLTWNKYVLIISAKGFSIDCMCQNSIPNIHTYAI